MPVEYHKPVMVREVLEHLGLQPGMRVADGTLGHGGHALEMARILGPEGLLIGLDRDPAMLAIGQERLESELGREGPKRIYAARPYEEIAAVLREHGIDNGLNAAVLDLGVNSMQVDDPRRGFSFSKDGPLDGRYNPQEGTMTMAELVNTASTGELERILRNYADERLARSIARRIVREREKAPFERTERLAGLVKSVYPAPQRHGPIHPATRTFQALRIAVNDELGAVERGTRACLESLAEGGRLAVISFHSGEDRIVKQLFREASSPRPDPDNPYSATTMEGVMYSQPVRRAVKCSEEEAASNPRARSARLRILERKEARDAA